MVAHLDPNNVQRAYQSLQHVVAVAPWNDQLLVWPEYRIALVPLVSQALHWFTDGQRRRLDGVGSERTADRSVRGEGQIRYRPGPEGIAGVSAGSVP